MFNYGGYPLYLGLPDAAGILIFGNQLFLKTSILPGYQNIQSGDIIPSVLISTASHLPRVIG